MPVNSLFTAGYDPYSLGVTKVGEGIAIVGPTATVDVVWGEGTGAGDVDYGGGHTDTFTRDRFFHMFWLTGLVKASDTDQP